MLCCLISPLISRYTLKGHFHFKLEGEKEQWQKNTAKAFFCISDFRNFIFELMDLKHYLIYL